MEYKFSNKNGMLFALAHTSRIRLMAMFFSS